MNRIDATFERLQGENKKAFIAYVCGGDPDYARSLEILTALADAGADIIELGLPFSDPLADGIVNQMAAHRALEAGANTKQMLELIEDFRRTHETPLVIFTYLNPVYNYGYEEFHRDAAAAGADGILLLDLPPDEAVLNEELRKESSLKNITLIAPNTPNKRLKTLAQQSEGFIYALSRTGVTGTHGGGPSESIGEQVAEIKQHTDTPVCVGFGISNPEQASMVAQLCDGIIVGSAIVKQIETHQGEEDLAQRVANFTQPLIDAVK